MSSDATAHAVGPFDDDDSRHIAFGRAIDAVRREAEAQVGAEDVEYVVQLNRFSRGLEVAGRVLVALSPEPVSFTAGVLCLFAYKQLQTAEIGHTVLHGAYDRLDGAEAFRSKTFSWNPPIDEASWRAGHNVSHHQYTNVARRDIDINYGGIRLTEQTPHRFAHYLQVPAMFLISWPFFATAMNFHFTGVLDAYGRGGWTDQHDVLESRQRGPVIEAHRRALRKMVPHFLREYVLFPALAGPFFAKVVAGNWLSERLRDLYSAATIYCGHVGPDVASYPEGTRAGGRGRWYAMQVEASNNFEVVWPLNILCGGLEHQIEHHLFPKLPPQRLRQIAPQVAQICRDHGVAYRSESWGRTLRKAIQHIATLSMPGDGILGGVRRVAQQMA